MMCGATKRAAGGEGEGRALLGLFGMSDG
jgi:hypothetical protein